MRSGPIKGIVIRTLAERIIISEAECKKNTFISNFGATPRFVIQFLQKNRTVRIKALSLMVMSNTKIIMNQNKLPSVECFDQPKMKGNL